MIRPEDKGALANGSDDRVALQTAIDAAVAGGEPLELTGGRVYTVASEGSAATHAALCLRAGLVMQGRGTIRLADGYAASHPEWRLLFAEGWNDRLDGMVLRDFRLDLNGANNLPAAMRQNAAINVVYGDDIRIEGITVLDAPGYHGICIGSSLDPVNCKRVTIRDCLMQWASPAVLQNTAVIFDHSAILAIALDAVVERNRIISALPWPVSSAIELHGSGSSARGNIIRNFYAGANLGGLSSDISGVEFASNYLSGAGVLVRCWSTGFGGVEHGANNIFIRDNIAELDQDPTWTTQHPIDFLNHVTNANLGHIEIVGNRLAYGGNPNPVYKPETVAVKQASRFILRDNSFAGFPGAPVKIDAAMDKAKLIVDGNVFDDCSPIAINSAVLGAGTLFAGDGGIALPAGSAARIGGAQIVGARKAGWATPTGTAARSAFDTETVGVIGLARRVKALIGDLTAHGLIGS